MTEKENPALEGVDGEEDVIIVMADEEGNEFYYREEMILPVGGNKFALLVPVEPDEDEAESPHEHGEGCGCGCGCDDEEDEAFFAKIVLDENGEEEYIEPTDEEFEAVCAAYDEFLASEEEEE